MATKFRLGTDAPQFPGVLAPTSETERRVVSPAMWAVAFFTAVLVVSVISAIMSVWMIVERRVVNASCPHAVCEWGVASHLEGGIGCETLYKGVGEVCANTCYTAGTGHCTNAHTCIGTGCLGDCVIENPDVDFPIYELDHPDCADKIVFTDFFSWNTSLSSVESKSWLYYSDLAPFCSAIHGCQAYVSRIRVRHVNHTVDWTWQTGSELDCLSYLNMTNSDCIQAVDLPMDESMANDVYRTLFVTPTVSYQAGICMYSYVCGATNTSAFIDPVYLQGKKRVVSLMTEVPTPGSVAYKAHLLEHAVHMTRHYSADGMRKQLAPRIHQQAGLDAPVKIAKRETNAKRWREDRDEEEE